MIITVFRSRMNEGVQDEYGPMAARMSELARSMPGYISHKTFTAADGERCTIAEFESEETLRAWSIHVEHIEAKRRGRDTFYAEYDIKTCSVIRSSTFKA